MDVELLLRLPGGAGEPQFAPDGAALAYVEDGAVWVRPLDAGGEPRRIGAGRAPRWQPRGGALAFLRADGDHSRVWLQAPGAVAEPRPLSPEGVAVHDYAWSPDGQALALLSAGRPRRDDLTNRLLDRRPGALRILGIATGEILQHIELPPDETAMPRTLAWSPDGRRLAWEVACNPEDRRENTREVRLLSLADGALRRVVPTGACQTGRPAWRPDGGALALAAAPSPHGYYALFGLATWDLRGGIARPLGCSSSQVERIVWAPDGQTLYVSARQAGVTDQLYAVSARDGGARQLTDGSAHHRHPAISPDGRWLACEVAAPDRLPEVWLLAADGSAARPLTDANRRLGAVPALHHLETELVRWRSVDGLELEGLLLYPPGYGPASPPPAPLPTIVDPHGGPVRQDPPRTLGDHPLHFTGLHALAERGYLCFSPDFRHSGNYGWAPLQRIIDTGESIGLDAADVASGVDHLIARGLADPARLGLRGFSYGAYLVNWLATQTGRFRAAVSADGMTDATVMPYPNTISETRFGGNQEEVPERYRRASPLTYAAQARTPLLLFEAAESLFARCRQGPAFRDALAAAGVAVEYVSYPGEPHMFFQPEHQADYLRRTLAWFDRWLR